nr:glycerophosphodiester phosphodiesterase family protein [uncultured Psychroserpens sp.]
MQKPLIIGHRGAKNHVVENTIESILKALEFNVDGIEIDVHKCATGELVVFHDFKLDRLTNGTGEINKYSLDELKSLKVNQQFTIPTLREVLDIIDKKCIVNIELKGSDTALETCNVVSYYLKEKGWHYSQFLISSFNNDELKKVYKINPQLNLGVLTETSVDDALEIAKSINAYALHPNYTLLTKQNVIFVQNLGYKVFTWTVNDIKAIELMQSFKVDAIITDNPDRL